MDIEKHVSCMLILNRAEKRVYTGGCSANLSGVAIGYNGRNNKN